ncbi:MAG TPA: hypothetical protein V6C65_16225 [Allocoleopsis sp.]
MSISLLGTFDLETGEAIPTPKARVQIIVDENSLKERREDKKIDIFSYIAYALDLERLSDKGKSEIDVAVFCEKWDVKESQLYSVAGRLSKTDPSIGFSQLHLDLY